VTSPFSDLRRSYIAAYRDLVRAEQATLLTKMCVCVCVCVCVCDSFSFSFEQGTSLTKLHPLTHTQEEEFLLSALIDKARAKDKRNV